MDSAPITTGHRPSRWAKAAALVRQVALAAVIGGLLFVAGKHYCFDRLDEEIRAHVEGLLRTHYFGLSVSVKSARRVAGRGVEIRGVQIVEAGGRNAPVLLQIDELFAECDTRLPDFVTRLPQITALHVYRLKLRAERRASGVWSASPLWPLPPCQTKSPPAVWIDDATIEIVDAAQQPACTWLLRNIELSVRPLEAAAEGPVLRAEGTLAGDHLQRMQIEGLLNLATGYWRVTGAVEGLEFGPRLRAALPRELGELLAPLASIRGRTQFGFQIERPASGAAGSSQGAGWLFSIDGKISEGHIADARLPEPLTDVEAAIHCDNRGISIRGLAARCGMTRIHLDASLAGYEGTGPIEMELAAEQLQLERLPVHALPPPVREMWGRFEPRGLADVSGTLRFDGLKWRPNFTAACRGLSLAYDRFPYRLTEGSGTVRVAEDALEVRLQAHGGGQKVHCLADVRNPGRDFCGRIEVQSQGPVPIDERLLAAMDPAWQRIVRAFHPRGAASFTARFVRESADTTLDRRVTVRLHDCAIQHEKFPYAIDKISGVLELVGNDWSFRNLTGRNDSAAITGEGLWKGTGRGGQLALRFTATDVPLADQLRQALPPAPQRLWANLRPRGNIDHLVVALGYAAASRRWSVEVQADKWPPMQGVLGPSITLEPAWFPYRLDDVTGSIRYRDGHMQLDKLHAVHGRTAVTAEGEAHLAPEGGCRLELSRLAADRVEVDEDLIAALPRGLGQAIGRFRLEGPFNLLGSLAIWVPPQADAPPQLDWNVSLDVAGGRIATRTPIEHLHGGVQLVGRQTGEGVFSRGELQLDSAMVRGVQIVHVEGPFWLDGRRLVFGTLAERDAAARLPRQITGRVFGGLVSLDGECSLEADGHFEVQAALENADLAEIARELAPHQRGLSGRVFGLAHVAGSTQGMHTWRGDGQIRLRQADIYELPLMIQLLSLLSIKRPDRTAFTTSSIDFRVEGDDLAFDRIDFSGDAISLKGKGRMNGQRQIDLKFYPILGREEWHLPVFRPLVGETGREFMLIQVTGTLDRPFVHRQVFPRIDAQLQQLFPELVRMESEEPNLRGLFVPREALHRLRLLPRK